jgi:hypothetical protein
MKRIHVIGLCLVAVFAFSAVAASAASAAEEYLFSAATFSFTSKGIAGQISKLLTVGGNTIECPEVLNKGETENAHLGKVRVEFKKCQAKTGLGNFGCKTGTVAEEIVIDVPFHLGTTSENAAVILLLPAAGIVINCGLAGNITVKGNVIGLLFKLDGTRLGLNEQVTSVNLMFLDTGTTGVQDDKSITLSLGGGTLTNQHLTAEVSGKTEEASQVSNDSLEKFSVSPIELVQ